MKKGFRKPPELSVYKVCIGRIFRLGLPNILMQSAYTFYILGLNLILGGFSDEAVTALGLYYKWQTFFFIPLGAMQTCIVPIISYNYASRKLNRCKNTLKTSVLFGLVLIGLGTLCFLILPSQMLSVFTSDAKVIEIGSYGFRFVGASFLPMVTSLIFPVFFQAIGKSLKKFSFNSNTNSCFVCTIGIYFLKVWSEFLLANIPCNRNHNQYCGCSILFAFPFSKVSIFKKVTLFVKIQREFFILCNV